MGIFDTMAAILNFVLADVFLQTNKTLETAPLVYVKSFPDIFSDLLNYLFLFQMNLRVCRRRWKFCRSPTEPSWNLWPVAPS